jgi:hypothetical protein
VASLHWTSTSFYTHSFDWRLKKLEWLIDHQVVRAFLTAKPDANEHQHRRMPSKFQFGIWSGGDPTQDQGMISWVEGITDSRMTCLISIAKALLTTTE